MCKNICATCILLVDGNPTSNAILKGYLWAALLIKVPISLEKSTAEAVAQFYAVFRTLKFKFAVNFYMEN